MLLNDLKVSFEIFFMPRPPVSQTKHPLKYCMKSNKISNPKLAPDSHVQLLLLSPVLWSVNFQSFLGKHVH